MFVKKSAKLKTTIRTRATASLWVELSWWRAALRSAKYPRSCSRASHLHKAYRKLSDCLPNRKPCYIFICFKLQIKRGGMFTLQWYLCTEPALNNWWRTAAENVASTVSSEKARNQRNVQSVRSLVSITTLSPKCVPKCDEIVATICDKEIVSFFITWS